MAIDSPELVGCVIMLAPSIAPELEPKEWYRLPLYLPPIRWFLPTSFDMTNREIYHLKDELESMLPLWENIRASTMVIQGGDDKLVHPGNADFAKKMIINAPVELVVDTEMGHFIPWSHPNIIREAIIKHLDLLNSRSQTLIDPNH
jgi:pimeloyl-ACP methyl ester carboxylesterase